MVVVPPISIAVRKFGRFLRDLAHKTQAAAAAASSIAEVCCSQLDWNIELSVIQFLANSVIDYLMFFE